MLLMKLKILGRWAGCSKISIGKDGALTLSVDGEQEVAKERIRKIFEAAPGYEFEVAYEAGKREQEPEQLPARVQVNIRTTLTANTVPGMAVEAAQLLGGMAK